MKIFNDWKKELIDSGEIKMTQPGIFWIQQKNQQQSITTASGKKSKADFDNGAFPVFTVTDFGGAKKFGWNFEKNTSHSELDSGSFSQKKSLPAINDHPELDSGSLPNYEFQTTKQDFITKVSHIKKLAHDGELWVLNLAVDVILPDLQDDQILDAFNTWLSTDSDKVGSVVWTDELKFVSFSPETFITQDQKNISTFPIKGTGSVDYLETSEKEKSELSMITDLLRNDLGQIAQKVTVPVARKLIACSDFYHAQAEIQAELNHNLTDSDYDALLPAGSISGAPKKRVVEVIKSVEDFERNFFTGTLCRRNSVEDLVSSILIRTFFKSNNVWHFPVGVGITHLSNPEEEWKELEQKLQGVLKFF